MFDYLLSGDFKLVEVRLSDDLLILSLHFHVFYIVKISLNLVQF